MYWLREMNFDEKDIVKTRKKFKKSTTDKKSSKKKKSEVKNEATIDEKIVEQKDEERKTKKRKVSKSKLKSNLLSTLGDNNDKENDISTEGKDNIKKVKAKSATKSKKTVLKDSASETKEKKPRKSKKKEKESQEIINESKDPSETGKKVWVEVFRDGRESISHNHPFKGIKLREPGPLKRLVSRQEWNAMAVDLTRVHSLDLPITHIRNLQTGGPVCRLPSECDELIHEMQWEQMRNGSADIKYNFLVTRNALIYEGRGWKHKSEDPAPPIGKSIDVAFVGDFTNKKVPKAMKKAVADLIDWGVYHYKIHCCHEVISTLDQKPKEDTAENFPQESLNLNKYML